MAIRSLLAAAGMAFAIAAAAQPQPIRIGTFLAVTGPAAFLGDPEQKTLELYVEKINAVRRADAHSELARWLAGNHEINNVLRSH